MKNLSLKNKLMLLFTAFLMVTHIAFAVPKKEKEKTKAKTSVDTLINSSLVSGIKWRSIGPAFTSGRIADFAVNPDDPSEFYVAVASGNIWKTENNGITFKPVFDKYGVNNIVAHNLSFDVKFLPQEIKNKIETQDYSTFCTMQKNRHLTPNNKAPKLIEACKLLGIEFDEDEAHSSDYDTLKCFEVFIKTID